MTKTFKEFKIEMLKSKKSSRLNFVADGRNYYIYRITNVIDNMHYYGARISELNPKLDIGFKYFSSSVNTSFIKDQKENPEKYKYKVVKVFDSNADKILYESFLHQYFNVKAHPAFYNQSNAATFGFDVTGKINTVDKDGNKFWVSKDDPRFISGELVSNFKNKIMVKDSTGKVLKVSTLDPRYLSGELKNICSGQLNVRDCAGKCFRVSVGDSRYLSGELTAACKNRINVKDDIGNILSIDRSDPRYLSGELKSMHSNTTVATNKETGITSRISVDEYKSGKYCTSTTGMMTVRDKAGNTFNIKKDEFDPTIHSSIAKGFVSVRDKAGNTCRVSVDDPRYLSGELVHATKGQVTVRDKDGKCFNVLKSDPRFISGEFTSAVKGVMRIKYTCPHCNKTGAGGNMVRYHFENCKSIK